MVHLAPGTEDIHNVLLFNITLGRQVKAINSVIREKMQRRWRFHADLLRSHNPNTRHRTRTSRLPVSTGVVLVLPIYAATKSQGALSINIWQLMCRSGS